MIEVSAWIGNICFVLCGIPQAWKSYKEKHSNGISFSMLMLWFWGNLLSLIYSVYNHQWPLTLGYLSGMANISIITYYKFKGGLTNYERF